MYSCEQADAADTGHRQSQPKPRYSPCLNTHHACQALCCLLCDACVQFTVFNTSTTQLTQLLPAEEWADSTVAEDLDHAHWADTRQAGIPQDGTLPMAEAAHQVEALLATAVEALAAGPGPILEADLAPHCPHHAEDAHLGHPRQVPGQSPATRLLHWHRVMPCMQHMLHLDVLPHSIGLSFADARSGMTHWAAAFVTCC